MMWCVFGILAIYVGMYLLFSIPVIVNKLIERL